MGSGSGALEFSRPDQFPISSFEVLIVKFQIQNPENPKSNTELTGECRGSEGGQIGYRGGRRDS